MKYINGNVIIISPPGMGKTTLLRDILRNIGNREGEVVGIVDERSEIASSYQGVAQNDVGERSDVIDACPKDIGMMMLLRTMSPTYIGIDEIGKEEDVKGIRAVIGGGANIVSTIHGENINKVLEKKFIRELIHEKQFSTYIEVRKDMYVVYNENIEKLAEIPRKKGVKNEMGRHRDDNNRLYTDWNKERRCI